jgi:hypothetical protein
VGLAGLGTVANLGLNIPIQAAYGGIGHGISAMAGRPHSDTRRSDVPMGAMPKMASVKLPEYCIAI